MAVPRPILLLSVLGAVLLAATFYTVRGARQQSQSDQISKAVQTAQPRAVKPLKPNVKAPAHGKHQGAVRPQTHRLTPAPHKAAPAKPAKPHPAGPAKPKDAGARLGLPTDVARAIGAHKTVVVLFYRSGLADDDATAKAVASVRSKRVSVFFASPKRFGSYSRLVGGLDLAGLPATVIVGRNRSARVVEGFMDSRTLAQEVADSG